MAKGYHRSILPDQVPKKGRPAKVISEETLKNLARIGATIPEMCAVLGVSMLTMENRLSKEPWHSAYYGGKAELAMSVRRKQIAMMNEGNAAMAIWLGKQTLGQRDNLDQNIDMVAAVAVAGSVTVRFIDGPDATATAATTDETPGSLISEKA